MSRSYTSTYSYDTVSTLRTSLLIYYRNISELQEQNEQLRAVIRALTEKQEAEERSQDKLVYEFRATIVESPSSLFLPIFLYPTSYVFLLV